MTMRRPKRNIFYKLYLFLEIRRMGKFLLSQMLRTREGEYKNEGIYRNMRKMVEELEQAI